MSGDDVVGGVVDELPGACRARLAPDLQIDAHHVNRFQLPVSSCQFPYRPAGSWTLEARRWTARSLLVAPLRRLHVLERQRFLVQDRRLADAPELPRRHVGEVLVVAQRLAVGRLALLAEVAAARLAAVRARRAPAARRTRGSRRRGRRIRGSCSGCSSAPAPRRSARTPRAGVESAPARARSPASLRAMPTSSHSSAPSSRWSSRGVLLPLDRQQPVDAAPARRLGFLEGVVVGGDLRERRAGEVVGQRVGDDEVAVGEPLHQRARAEPVGAVVREVGLAEHVQPRDGAHQVVVHPQAAHRVVDGRVDPHRDACTDPRR